MAPALASSGLRPGVTLRGALGVWRRHARLLAIVSALVLLPELVIRLIAGAGVHGATVNVDDSGSVTVQGLHLVLELVLAIEGEEFLAGFVERIVMEDRFGRARPSLGALARHLPWWSMFAAAAMTGLVVSIALSVFVLPGIYLAALYLTVGPIVVIERTGAWKALGRSRRLSRGHRLPLMVVAAAALAVSTLVGTGAELAVDALGASGSVGIVADYFASVATAPFFALVAVLSYVELRAITGDPLHA